MPIMADAEWEEMKRRFKRDFDRIWQECLEKYGLAELPNVGVDRPPTKG